MTPEERSLIEGLFQRLNEAAKTLPAQQVDPEADRAIRAAVSAQPLAPYLLVQNALVMENAMVAAQARIAELEAAQAAPAPAPAPSFLSGASPWKRFGAGQSPAPAHPQQAAPQRGFQPQGYGQPQGAFGQQQGQPSFLRSALTTAAGVAGGALLFQGISSLLSSHGGGTGLASAAQAASAPASSAPAATPEATPASYDAPLSEDRGYTPASYDEPEPDYGSDFGDSEA